MIDKRLIDSPGTPHGMSKAITELKREVRSLKANQNQLYPNSITNTSIANNTITAGQIADGTITAVQIAANTITAGQIAAGTITAAQIASGTITSNEIAAHTITATNIAAGTITSAEIAAGTITATNILAGTITGTQIAANTITATNMSVTSLSAISANLGTITAGTITGATFQTAASGARVVFNSAGIKAYDSSNVNNVTIDSTTGLITATGVITAQAGSIIPVNTLNGNLPGSANRYSNSAFQDGAGTFDTTGWDINNATSASGGTDVPPIFGVLTLKLTASSTSHVSIDPATTLDSYKRVIPGLSYTFSHFVWPATTARQTTIDIVWYDASGTQLSVSGMTWVTPVLGQWNRISNTAIPPANAAYAKGFHYGALNPAANEVTYMECLQMESGDRVSAWAPRPDEILYNTINANMIQANTITAAKIAANTITAGQIAANTITATQIASNTITASQIAAATITGTQVAANTITASNISVSTLSAISANLGTVTAGTITGGTLQTASTDPRTALDSSGFWVSDNTGAKQISIEAANGIRIVGSGGLNTITYYDTSITGTVMGVFSFFKTSSTRQGGQILTKKPGSSSINQAYIIVQGDTVSDTQNFVDAFVYNAASTKQQVRNIVSGDGTSSFIQHASVRGLITDFAGANNSQAIAMDGGSGTVTFTASNISASTTVNHGLGFTPAVIIITCKDAFGVIAFESTNRTSTNFKVGGEAFSSISATISFDWLALG